MRTIVVAIPSGALQQQRAEVLRALKFPGDLKNKILMCSRPLPRYLLNEETRASNRNLNDENGISRHVLVHSYGDYTVIWLLSIQISSLNLNPKP